jgi:antitoxin ChpS
MTIEPEILAVLKDLKRRLRRRFGDRLDGLYLFGSRARGDAEPDSDIDVAVILKGRLPESPFGVTREILEDTYDLLLETGLDIQPWPLEEGSLDEPEAHPYATVSRAVRREGVAV